MGEKIVKLHGPVAVKIKLHVIVKKVKMKIDMIVLELEM